MRQSRLMSLVEAVANVGVGLVVAVATQVLVFPILGLQASLGAEREAGAGVHRRVDRAELRAAAGVRGGSSRMMTQRLPEVCHAQGCALRRSPVRWQGLRSILRAQRVGFNPSASLRSRASARAPTAHSVTSLDQAGAGRIRTRMPRRIYAMISRGLERGRHGGRGW